MNHSHRQHLARPTLPTPFGEHWGRQRDLELPRLDAHFYELNTEKKADTTTIASDRGDALYFEQLLCLRDVRHLDEDRRGRRKTILQALAHFLNCSGQTTHLFFPNTPTATHFQISDTDRYSLIRYLVLRTAGSAQNAAFQSDDYARPLESEPLRAWSRQQGLSDLEFQLICQLDFQVDFDMNDIEGMSPRFERLWNASRVRRSGLFADLHLHDWEGDPGLPKSPDALS